MSGLIVPSSYNQIQTIGRGEDVNDITRSVQDGDPTVGWRGDPSMDVYREGSQVRVYGFDRSGERYVAATVNLVDSDWRRTLLTKLRDGDWQNEYTMVDRINDANAKLHAENQRKADDRISEIADKYVSARLRDDNSKRYF